MPAAELEPIPDSLAVFPSFIAKSPTTLILKESVFSLTEPFTVKTIDGNQLFIIKADSFPLSSEKRIYDAEKNHLFTLQKETFSFPKSFYAVSPEGHKIFEVEGKLHFGSSKAIGHFFNATDNERVKIELKGTFFSTKTEIKNAKNGQVVAHIDRERWNTRQLIANRDTYAVTVAPGMDMAIIVAMVVYLDETRQH